MHILITNDDGINAPGIQALADIMNAYGKVTVIAPEQNWSVTGHTRVFNRPLTLREHLMPGGRQAYACSGSPSDCVALGLRGFLSEPVDLVVSGINDSENIAQDVTYSGTISAAFEAHIWNTPAIAFSLFTARAERSPSLPDFYECAQWVGAIFEFWQSLRHQNVSLWNVNLPMLPHHHLKGLQVTRLGRREYRTVVEKLSDPRGHEYYWALGEKPGYWLLEGSDASALHDGYVSLTPLSLDMTDADQRQYLQDHITLPVEQHIMLEAEPLLKRLP